MATLVLWLLAVVVTVALRVEPSGATYIIQAGNVSSSSSLGRQGVVAVKEGRPYGNEIAREEELLLQERRRERQGVNAVPLSAATEYGRKKKKKDRRARARTRASSRNAPDATPDTSNSSSSSSSTHQHFPPSCPLPPGVREEIRGYQKTVDQIVEYVVSGPHKGRAYDTLAQLVDDFGPRLTGTGVLEEAIDHMIDKSIAEGLENVHTEDVVVPKWFRNEESAWMLEPRVKKMSILGLGSSVPTPPGGITAEVLVVKDFDDLERHASQAVGKIVVYNPEWVSYGATVQYRSHGASRASRVGAVAALIRSVTPFSLNTPHTGQQFYDARVVKIPVACITVEDAAMMERLQRRGVAVEVRLEMGAQTYPDSTSRNTIAEVEGWQHPEEVVVVSGHLDSWDVGQGAMDDGGGAMISWEAGVVLKKLGLRPRRTFRTILWTGEEQGLHGGLQYFDRHQHEADRFQLIMESDSGTFTPQGLGVFGTEEGECAMQEIMNLLHAVNATLVKKDMNGGPDIGVWKKLGVPLGSLLNANEKYFYYHHSAADMLTIEDPATLDLCLAVWTSVAYVAADMSYRLPHAPPSEHRRVVVSSRSSSSDGSLEEMERRGEGDVGGGVVDGTGSVVVGGGGSSGSGGDDGDTDGGGRSRDVDSGGDGDSGERGSVVNDERY